MTRVALVGDESRMGDVRARLVGAPGIELAPMPNPALGDVVVIAAELEEAVRIARSIEGQRPVVLVIDGGDTSDGLRAALEAGARGCVSPSDDAFSLRRAIASAEGFTSDRASVREQRPGGSRIVAVIGAGGGVGTTTVAIGLARACEGVLVDLDSAGGDAASRLGRATRVVGASELGDPGRALGELLEQCDEVSLVQAAPCLELSWTVPSGACSLLLREARRSAQLVVVDAGRGAGPALEAIIEADVIVVVAPPDRPERAADACDRIARLATPRARIITVLLASRSHLLGHRAAAVRGRWSADLAIRRVREPDGAGRAALAAALQPLSASLLFEEAV